MLIKTGVVGIGYEGRTVDDVVSELVDLGVATLADVRLTPISRKPGLSKRALSKALEAASIDYLHLPELGNPKANRAGYAELATVPGCRARAAYAARLSDPPARAAIERLAGLARLERVCVLCFERSELHCHRNEVIHAVRQAQLSVSVA